MSCSLIFRFQELFQNFKALCLCSILRLLAHYKFYIADDFLKLFTINLCVVEVGLSQFRQLRAEEK